MANRCYVSAHECGMTGEYPYLYHAMDYDESGYDGVLEPGMTLCVEIYIGEEGGNEGVKLEQQLLITEREPELLSSFHSRRACSVSRPSRRPRTRATTPVKPVVGRPLGTGRAPD